MKKFSNIDSSPSDGFVWTENALINLQYITAYLFGCSDDETNWLYQFDKHREWAKEFTLNEPDDWAEFETDYETAIQAFIRHKIHG